MLCTPRFDVEQQSLGNTFKRPSELLGNAFLQSYVSIKMQSL